jgi:hypothetical protein
MKKNVHVIVAVLIGIAVISVAMMGSIKSAHAAKPASGPGHVLIGVDASTWTSGAPAGPGLVPIGGGGQLNGEFTVAERYGIQIGLRAQERFVGPSFMAVPNNDNKVGVYETTVGFSDAQDRATWNYDWHIDLRDAFGVAEGTTIADYDLTLETDMFTSLFTFPVPVDLTFGGFIPGDTILLQSSQNPDFGNNEFDAEAVGTYTFTLVLTPTSFKGPPLSVSIQVNAN